MKKYFVLLIATLGCKTMFAQQEIKIEDARSHIGDTVKVCTKIFATTMTEAGKGDETMLFAGGAFPDQKLTIVIKNDNRKNFDYKPEKDLKERNICVTGLIELVKDQPVMMVQKQSQIDIK